MRKMICPDLTMVVGLAMAHPGAVSAVLSLHQVAVVLGIQVTTQERGERLGLVHLLSVAGLSLAPLIQH